MKILITGVAGFIGAAVANRLLSDKHDVIGIDNLNDYYDVSLKQSRLAELGGMEFHKIDLVDRTAINELFANHQFDVVVNMAAQAGVRYSIENPAAYIDSNIVGFGNLLEACRHSGGGCSENGDNRSANKSGDDHNDRQPHLVYASSSSVYGANKNFPFSESDRVDNPVSLYAATKKSNELMAHSYTDLFAMRCTGLRFFTVYGPQGRPDMAPFLFADKMLNGQKIKVFNQGDMLRDFTYIDDIVEGVARVVLSQAPPNGSLYSLYNIGRGQSIQLMRFIELLADNLGVKVEMDLLPMQAGDVPRTGANTGLLAKDFDYQPTVSVEQGVRQFAEWYRAYYQY